jgi:4-hydroxy-3-polyprenylbenzoate decarboxylase
VNIAAKRSGVALAMTGASGVQYGLRLLECLISAGRPVHLMLSKPAIVVIGMETDEKLPGRPVEMQRYFSGRFNAAPGQLKVYGQEEWTACVASGSGAPGAMVVCPCSMATLSAIAVGASRSLIERAADVMLKERRTLIIVPRETPFSTIHLRNMLAVAEAGGLVLPANPGFYHRPKGVGELVDYVVARILDQLGMEHDLMSAWGGEPDPVPGQGHE